ncbi:MAG: hypothetical protein WB797_14830 [Nocardioides sp.]
MPRLIDYVGRFEFIRRAAFAVVRDESVDALSRRRVAAELGTGVNTIRRSVAGWADLAQLAADHVRARRRAGGLGRRSQDEPADRAAGLVRSLMPEDATHLDEELVWLKLVTACALRPSGLEPPGQVRREFQIAQRGYDDGESAPATPGQQATGERPDRRKALERYVHERDEELNSTISLILDLLEMPEPREDAHATVLALVEGLTLSACLGRLTPERATETAVAHVVGLRSERHAPPG